MDVQIEVNGRESTEGWINTLRSLKSEETLSRRVQLSFDEKSHYSDDDDDEDTLDRSLEPQLYELLSTYPLVELRLHYAGYSLSASTLAAIIRQTSATLKSLRLTCIVLDGDLTALAAAVQDHPNLEVVHMNHVSVENDGTRNSETTVTLLPVLRSLASCPNLHEVRLECLDDRGTEFSATYHLEVIRDLILQRKSSLQTLFLKGFRFLGDSAAMIDIFRSLQTHPTLKQFRAMTYKSDHRLKREAVIAFSDMLKHKNILESVFVCVDGEAASLQPIVQALRVNSSLKRLCFYVGRLGFRVSEAVSDSFREMLEKNYVLESLHFYGATLQDEMVELYLRLNRVGRRRLLEGDNNATTQEDWWNVIINHSQEVNIVYYLLSKNPTLVQRASPVCEERPQKRPRRRREAKQVPPACNDDT